MRQTRHTDQTTLVKDPLERLMHLSQTLLSIAEQEKECLRENNVNKFSDLQDEKQPVSRAYLEASEAFRSQIMNYKEIPAETLSRLEALQEKLQEKSRENTTLMHDATHRQNYAHTGCTLFATQAIGQDNSKARQSSSLSDPTSPYTPTYRGRA